MSAMLQRKAQGRRAAAFFGLEAPQPADRLGRQAAVRHLERSRGGRRTRALATGRQAPSGTGLPLKPRSVERAAASPRGRLDESVVIPWKWASRLRRRWLSRWTKGR